MKNDLRDAIGTDSQGRVMAHEIRRERVKPQKKPRQKREGHDELIAKLSPVGTEITLFMQDGEVIYGRLHGSDRFTISLSDVVAPGGEDLETDPLQTSEDSPVLIFYKHSIVGFKLKVIGDRIDRRG